MYSIKNISLLIIVTILSTACQGTYLNGFLVVDTIKPQEERRVIGQRSPKYGECHLWKSVRVTSQNDVDTSYSKIIRSGVINYPHLPLTNNDEININFSKEWKHPIEKPGLFYKIPPRWSEVLVNNFNQSGVVSIGISKNNQRNLQGSLIDVEYCEGGKYDIGFYVPHHLKNKFEHNLKTKIKLALR